MTYLFYAILATIGYGVSHLFGKKLIQRTKNPIFSTFLTSLFLCATSFSVVIFKNAWQWPEFSQLPLIFITVVIGAIGLIALYKAFTIEKIGIVSSAANAYPIIVYFLTLAFYPLELETQKIVVLFIVLFGLALISLDDLKSFRMSRGMLLGLVAGTGWAIYAVCIRITSDSGLNPLMAVFIIEFLLMVTLFLVILFQGKILEIPFSITNLKPAFGNGLCMGLGSIFYGLALGLEHPALVASIESTNPLITAVLAYYFFGEKLKPHNILGIMIIILGVVGLSY